MSLMVESSADGRLSEALWGGGQCESDGTAGMWGPAGAWVRKGM